MAAPFLILHHRQMQIDFFGWCVSYLLYPKECNRNVQQFVLNKCTANAKMQYASPLGKYFMSHSATVQLYELQPDRKNAICIIVIMMQCAKVQNVLRYIFALNMQQCTMQKRFDDMMAEKEKCNHK